MTKYEAEQKRKEEERRPNSSYNRSSTSQASAPRKKRKARAAALKRIIKHAAVTFTLLQLSVILRALINLDPHDFAKDVAEFCVGGDDNNHQSPEEIFSFNIDRLPDEKLSGFALRLVLTGHTNPAGGQLPLSRPGHSRFHSAATPRSQRPKTKSKAPDKKTPTAAKTSTKQETAKNAV
jgi:ParB family chromosome partitioning protein